MHSKLPDSGSIIGIAFALRFFCCPGCCWDVGARGNAGGGTCGKFWGPGETTCGWAPLGRYCG